MPDEARFRVREAILMKTASGSQWKVTFAPLEATGIGSTEGEVTIWVSLDRVDAMSFAARYTLAEIETFRDDRPHD